MDVDLDAALNELGMLSSVTDSRKDYLEEQATRRSPCYNIVQLNPTYVTCLGPVRHPVGSNAKMSTDVEEAPRSLRASDSVPNLRSDEKRVFRGHQRSKPRYSRPYHIPKQASTCTSSGRPRRTTDPTEEKRETGGTKSTISALTCLDQESTSVCASFLTRSKSVNDLSGKEPGPVFPAIAKPAIMSQHQELEVVSRHLRDLQVSSS